MTAPRQLPALLLTVFVILPVLALGVAGLNLLRHERERLEAIARDSTERLAEEVADDLRGGLAAARNEIQRELDRIGGPDFGPPLRELRERHPLVRQAFWVGGDGKRRLPPVGVNLDGETEDFTRRFDALFSGRVPWIAPVVDTAPPPPAASRYQSKSIAVREFLSDRPAETSANRVFVWKPWTWEDRDTLLAYQHRPESGDIVGVEIEMAALYSRLNVLLMALARPGEPLLLMDRRDHVVLASEETPERPPRLMVEIGSHLPFARLGLHGLAPPPGVWNGHLFHVAALAVGLALLGSIVAATLGLTSWLHRSREDAMRKTTFVSNVSHEFKTPLTTIRLYTELMLEGRVPDEAKRERYLRTMRDESDRLARLVHNVLDFSRLEMGRKTLVLENFDGREELDRALDSLQERCAAAGVRVSRPEIALPVRADRDAFGQIVLNLCDNAIKYAAAGGRLDIRAGAVDGTWRLAFADAGPGIPRKQRKRVFQPFHQVDERITRGNGGTGLGLHISARLAKEMGGKLELADSPVGACFVWTLPRASPEPTP